MNQSYSKGKFEYFVVATIVALVTLIALDRYTLIAKDARILRLEIISHHFMIAAANMRIEFLTSRITSPSLSAQKALSIDGKLIFVSDQGWPVSTVAPVTDNFQPSDADCYQLWQLLLQNPAPISTGQYSVNKYKYRTFAYLNHCRYELANGDALFDYFPLSGRLLFSAINR